MAKLSASLTEEAVPVMKLTSWENPLLFHPQLNATLGLEYIRRYNREGADFIELDKPKLRNMKLNIVVEDLAVVDDRNGIRHDPIKLAQSIFKIVCDNMDLEDNDKAIEYYTAKSKLKKMSTKNKKKSFWLSDVKIINPKKAKRKRR